MTLDDKLKIYADKTIAEDRLWLAEADPDLRKRILDLRETDSDAVDELMYEMRPGLKEARQKCVKAIEVEDTEKVLEELLEMGLVVRVDYTGENRHLLIDSVTKNLADGLMTPDGYDEFGRQKYRSLTHKPE